MDQGDGGQCQVVNLTEQKGGLRYFPRSWRLYWDFAHLADNPSDQTLAERPAMIMGSWAIRA